MRAAELPADDELRELIARAHPDLLGLPMGTPIVVDFPLGTKPDAPWKRAALFAVNDLRAEGVAVTEAVRTVFETENIRNKYSSTLESFVRSYEKFRNNELLGHFYSSILLGEIDEAISALKLCSDRIRKKIWDDLNSR